MARVPQFALGGVVSAGPSASRLSTTFEIENDVDFAEYVRAFVGFAYAGRKELTTDHVHPCLRQRALLAFQLEQPHDDFVASADNLG